MRKKVKTVLFAGCLCAVTAFAAQAGETEQASEAASVETEAETEAEKEVVSFLSGDFYKKEIKDENDAKDAVMSVIDSLGGDENTSLELLTVRPNENGLSVYTFGQMNEDLAVYGASVKLIVGKDGHVCALSNSLESGIDSKPIEEWGITGEEAEQIVLKNAEGKDLKIVEDTSEQALLPIPDSTEFYYAWIVYTNNPDPQAETTYMAHYVDEQGEYLYGMPVMQPGDPDSHSGEGASLIFLDFEEDTWTGTVTKHDGTTKELTVPVLKDKETGERYLGDMNRKVLCIDYADYDFNDKITIRKEEDGRFADNELLIYETFLRTYDLYEQAGWTGPDGEGTPTLLRMDMVNENGDPIQNAAYTGKKHGYQCFEFNRLDPDGECTDIIAHEFTHCVTDNLMAYTRYFNEFGAMNEAFSDICGNIIEAIYKDSDDTTWLIQECGTPIRSMSDPRQFKQPSHVWDVYYLPETRSVGDYSDLGGVHINSSLVNKIGYRLNETGMPLEDQLYYWMNVILTLTSNSDYSDLMEILVWCADTLGYSQYIPALQDAFKEVGIADTSMPDTAEEGYGRIQIELPQEEDESLHAVAQFINMDEDGKPYLAVPRFQDNLVAATLPAGHFVTMLCFYDDSDHEIMDAILTEDGWKTGSQGDLMDMVNEGVAISFCELNVGDISVISADKQEALMQEVRAAAE